MVVVTIILVTIENRNIMSSTTTMKKKATKQTTSQYVEVTVNQNDNTTKAPVNVVHHRLYQLVLQVQITTATIGVIVTIIIVNNQKI